jgi:hypothetical protein
VGSRFVDSLFLPLIEAGTVVLGAMLFAILTMACEVGFRVGRRRGRTIKKSEEETSATSTLTAGMLALLAFMLGLTIDFAQNRFEARRDRVAEEATTIDTAWSRAKLIGGPEGEAMAALIADYAKTRLDFTGADYRGPVPALIARTEAQKNAIWALATEAARKSPTPVMATLVTALNSMFDAALSQRFAFDGRVPGDMIDMLIVGSMLAIGAMGYELGLGGIRQPVLSSLLLIMWTGGLVMTVDLELPRRGDIRVETAPLQWVIESFAKAPPDAPAPHP